MNKTLLVGGKLYIWESGNWTAAARCRGLLPGSSGAHIGATLAIEPHGYPCRVFPPQAALDRAPVPGGNWANLSRVDIDNVSAWQLRPCIYENGDANCADPRERDNGERLPAERTCRTRTRKKAPQE